MSHNNVFLNSKYASGFSPQVIPGLTLWLDAADRSTLTLSGSNITQWRDKSPNAFTVSNNGSNPPGTVLGAQFNNLPVVSFPSNSQMNVTMAIPNSNSRSLFYVARASSAGSSFVMPLGSLSTNGNESYFIPNATSTNFNALDRQGVITTCSFTYTGGSTQDTVFMLGAVAGTAGTINGNTQSITTSAPNFATASITYTISRSLYTRTWELGEMILFNVNLDTAQRQQVEAYLAWKWGLVGNLPTAHPYKTARLFTRPFNPLDIAGCQFWIDAADARTVTLSGNTVTGVADKSGNGRNLSNGNIFTYNQTLFNGKYPSFYNSSTGGLLGLNSSVSLAQPLTIFAMAQSETPNNTFAHIADSLNSGSRVVLYFWNSNSSFRTRLFAGGEIEDLSGPMTFVNSYVANTTASQIYINGALRTSGDIGSGALSGLVIASRFTTTEQSWRGHLCEVLIYSSVLSSSDRQQVENYLAEKWGLRSSLSTSNALRLYESLSPVFNPTLISNCSLWLDVADRSSLTLSGSSITGIVDKSGSGISVSVSTSRPTLNSSFANGLSAANFTGSQWFRGNFSSTYGGSNLAMFAVASVNSATTTNGRLLSLSTTGAFDVLSTNINILRPSGTQGVAVFRGSVYSTASVSGYNTPFMMANVVDGASTTIHINGALGASNASSGSFSINNFGVAYLADYGGTADTAYWIGNISEVIFYLGAITPQTRQRIEAYLSKKWNIALPTTHPYYTIPV
jgi:hypothetical protein